MQNEQNVDKSSKHIPWVSGRPKGYLFEAKPLVINATPDEVWKLMTDIPNYKTFSKGAITAYVVEMEFKENNHINLELYKNKKIGKFIPTSKETITFVDENTHMIAWERTLPLKGGVTERVHILEALEEGKKTASYIALKIPSAKGIGFFTSKLMKKKIEKAFDMLNEGIKKAAENTGPGLTI